MKTLFRRYRHLLLFSLFGAVSLCYFLIQLHPAVPAVIHVALDDRIPFLPVFIVPYILWYLYVPVSLLYVGLHNKTAFYRQCTVLFSGAALGMLIFFFFPTCIDFRPTAEGRGVWLWLCRIIYANDNPVNVCPSLHCYEAVIVHLTTFRMLALRRCTALRVGSAVTAVLICASTVFAKQHSIVDVVCGVALAFAVYILFYRVLWKESYETVPLSGDAPAKTAEKLPVGEKMK